MIKKKKAKQVGLVTMYHLEHADGTPADPKGAYFVLKLNSKDTAYAKASIMAVLAFANVIRPANRKLAQDLDKWVMKHWRELQKRKD